MALLAELLRIEERNRLFSFKPYAKQRRFFDLGATKRTRALFGGNQVGKTVTGGFEWAAHLTGQYPDWWGGHRFKRPVKFWAAGETSQATRDVVQTKLLGPPEIQAEWGTGFLPAASIISTQRATHGVANAVDSVLVGHASGGQSTLWFKAYDQGRQRWQGPTLDGVWFDEEPDWQIWSEGTTRCNAVADARIVATFTPLKGVSEVVTYLLNIGSL